MFLWHWHFRGFHPVFFTLLPLLVAIVLKWMALSQTTFGTVGENTQRNTTLAVVIPFVNKDLDSLLLTLTEGLAPGPSFPPCNKSAAITRHLIDVILYTTQPIPHNSPLVYKFKWLENRCIRKVHALTVSLPPHEDTYPLGPSAMFFALFHETSFIERYDYMFWHEPDVHACRPYWLDQLFHTATNNPSNAWIRGSILYQFSSENSDISVHDIGEHINGNAIYSLHDVHFRKFITEKVEPVFWNDTESYLNSFDVAIEWIRRDQRHLSRVEFAETSPRFQYHRFIENWYRKAVNITKRCERSKDALFIHGRHVYR